LSRFDKYQESRREPTRLKKLVRAPSRSIALHRAYISNSPLKYESLRPSCARERALFGGPRQTHQPPRSRPKTAKGTAQRWVLKPDTPTTERDSKSPPVVNVWKRTYDIRPVPAVFLRVGTRDAPAKMLFTSNTLAVPADAVVKLWWDRQESPAR